MQNLNTISSAIGSVSNESTGELRRGEATSTLKLNLPSHHHHGRRRSGSKKTLAHVIKEQQLSITAPSPRISKEGSATTHGPQLNNPVLSTSPALLSSNSFLSVGYSSSPPTSPKADPTDAHSEVTPPLRNATSSLIENYVKARVNKKLQRQEQEERKRSLSVVEQKRVDRYLSELSRSQSACEVSESVYEIPSFDDKKRIIRKNQLLFQKATENVLTASNNRSKDRRSKTPISQSFSASQSPSQYKSSQRNADERYSMSEVVERIHRYFNRSSSSMDVSSIPQNVRP